MKRKWMFVITIAVVLVLCLGMVYYFWHKDQQEKEEANRVLFGKYVNTAGNLHLEMDSSKYNRTGDPHDIELTPTNLTYDLLQRWEAMAEAIPTIEYPEEDVEQENWLEVFNTLVNNRPGMEVTSEEITKGTGEGSVNSMAINDYLYKGTVYNDIFREFLEENGIEGPDQRRLE
ncbi:hypothetical protein [Shouchella clausii]|uniref:hypothetical protein n=1 Tax=Shouchella clausii TaxID=79880 RepID=UPI0026FF8085|nr:hypothetical protein [Shouchella clausii]MDO7269187.1 hypothetical protein [Shouchella clausii]MDO7288596.1 hypothetical protein [Shouchella clausii]